MSKVNLLTVTNGQNISAINQNFAIIADALNNGTLWRDNPVGEPNNLENNIDANGFQIFNVALIVPNSNAGLPVGAIYNDNGILKVVMNV